MSQETLLFFAALAGAFLVAAVGYAISWARNGSEDGETSAPDLKPFSNPITFTLLWICLLLIISGIYLVATGNMFGIGVGMLGVLIWWLGDTKHPVDPRTAGVLTIWDTFIRIGGRPVVVGGRTILANYWPFYLSSAMYEFEDVDHEIKDLVFIAKNNFRLKGKISLRLRPKLSDPIDYIQSGKMEKILRLLDDIIYKRAQFHVKQHDGEDISKDSSIISNLLTEEIKQFVEAESLGVEILQIQTPLLPTDDMMSEMEGKAKEKYQRQAEFAEYTTDLDAANELLERYRRSGDTTTTLKECLSEIKQLRLIRDERTARIESVGSTGTVNLIDTKLDMGKGGKGKKEK